MLRRYGIIGALRLIISLVYTKTFYPNARLIRLPFDIRNNKPKSFLIDYSKNIFPSNYKYNPKRGFNFTDKFVSNSIWTKYFRTIVENSNSEIINKKYLNFLIDNLGKGDSNKFNKVYSIIVLLRWISKNKLILN